MLWHTEINVTKLPVAINHATEIVMLGSCFTDEVGARLRRQLFDVDVNPLGTLFNPISIADALADALDNRMFDHTELFEVDGTWRTLRRHSRFSLPDPDATLTMLNDSLASVRRRLRSANLLVITFGSAMAHRHIPSRQIVANCHKLPGQLFNIEQLSVKDITERWRDVIDQLQQLNPSLNIVFTVSPVRHIGYGLQRDRLSKSTLIVAVNELINDRIHYFPSYEAVVDDLRDYRWYADDMVHPSAQAVDYVYEIFRRSAMTPDTIAFADRWEKLTRRLAHRHSTPQAAQEFLTSTLTMAETLAQGDNSLFQRFTSLIK